MIRIKLLVLLVIDALTCWGDVCTNVSDGIVWMCEKNDTSLTLQRVQRLDARREKEPRRVTIPAEFDGRRVGVIGKGAFKDVRWVGDLEVPDEVRLIDSEAFSGCANLTNVTMHGDGTYHGVGRIAYRAFYGCTNLETVVFAPRLQTIENAAFLDCRRLKGLVWPKTLAFLGQYAFGYCEKLESANLFLVMQVGENPFAGCKSLREIRVDPANAWYLSDAAGVLYSRDRTLLIAYPPARTNETYTVPKPTMILGWNAFACATNLNQVVLPSTLREISRFAFYESGLKTVKIPRQVECIEEGAFDGCPVYIELEGNVGRIWLYVVLAMGAGVGCGLLWRRRHL